MSKIEITVGTHFFQVRPTQDQNVRKMIYDFVRRFVKVDVQGNERKITTYASANTARTWFRFHINTFGEFDKHLKSNGFEAKDVTVYYLPEPDVPTHKFNLDSSWSVLPHQEPVIEYLTRPIGRKDDATGKWVDGGSRQRLVGLQTGRGKTFCALKSITDLGYKFVVIVLARFVKNWVKEIQKITDIKAKEILLVDSSSAMKALTEMAVTPGSMDPYKAIVMGNRSFLSYITAFENSGADIEALGYMVTPDELWTKLGIGIRLIDEVHMEFHANFRLDLYTHIKRTISLSATLISDDPHEKRMHNIAYPKDERSEEQQLTKYIDSFGVVYTIPNRWHYKTAYRGSSNYSHAAFEDSILRNKDFTKAYADMHIHWLKHGYQKNWQPDHKAIVFASTKEMCAELTKQISNAFPNYTVRRYVAEDGGKKDKQGYEENYQKPHIRVTTIGSGGTGHDIKGLTDNILGVGLSSTKSNVQVLGRLRDIPGKQTRFYYMSCLDIPKQMHYHMAKKDLLKQRAKSFTPLHYGELGDNRYRT